MELIKYREVLLGGDILSPDTVSYIEGISQQFKDVPKLCFLAKSTGSSISTSSTYIVFLAKLQKKGKPPKMDLPFLKNDITRFCWR